MAKENNITSKRKRENAILAYDRACAALLHYGTAIRTIRITSVSQGAVIIGGASLALSKIDQTHEYLAIICATVYGLISTFILWRMQEVYWNYFSNHLGVAASLEKQELGFSACPWYEHLNARDKFFPPGSCSGKLINGGLFGAICLALVGITVLCCVKLFQFCS